jgi:uncharacterized membrane protein
VRTASIYALAVLFVGAGLAHFVWPSAFARIVPPALPAPRALVFVSGAFEILGGIGLLVPALRVWAGWGLILLLIAVFPANVHMALRPDRFPALPVWALYLRLPLQFVLAAWVYGAAVAAPR